MYRTFSFKVLVYLGVRYDDLPNHSISKNNPLKIVPNPTNDYVSLYFDGYKSGTSMAINVYSITGQIVYSQTSNLNPLKLDLTSLQAGTYIIRLENGLAGKFVKY